MRQRTKNDCVIVAIAVASGRSYKEIKDIFGKLDRGGMLWHEIEWLLSQTGNWRRYRKSKLNLSSWVQSHSGRYVVLLDKLTQMHAVAVVDGVVHGEYAEQWGIVAIWKFEGVQ